jgi:Fe-S oxidoreductase
VTACPTCTAALKHEFISTLESLGRHEWLPEARELSAKTVDFSCLVKQLMDEGRLSFRNGRHVPLTYHDSCHLKRTLHVSEEPRELLRRAGHEIVEMFEADICCGMGGSYSLKLPEISGAILKRKLHNIEATGVSEVAADCPGCVMQIRGGCDKKGLAVRVRHTAERLAEELG